jgi:formate dehydrogenase maturation protein FdhE
LFEKRASNSSMTPVKNMVEHMEKFHKKKKKKKNSLLRANALSKISMENTLFVTRILDIWLKIA